MNRKTIVLLTLAAGLHTAAIAIGDVVTYTIDPSQSRLTLSGAVRFYFNGSVFGFAAAAPGSMETAFAGTITGDRSGANLTLLGGSSIAAVANPAGPFLPAGPGAVDAYGMRTFANGGAIADNRMYDITLDLTSGAITDGAAFTGNLAYTAASGGIFPFFDSAPRSLAGVAAANTAPAPASLTLSGPIETLIIPVDANLILFGNGTGVETRLTGTLIATRIIPAPGAIIAFPLATLFRRRRR